MSDEPDKPAAFKAAYSEWKVIKTRGFVQVIFEVSIENSDEAYQVLGGMPRPGKETWFGIARLDPEFQPKLTPESESGVSAARPSPMPPARATPSKQPENKACQRLGILCHEPAFRKFLEDRRISPRFVNTADSAAIAVRDYFGVKSRTEIWEDNPKYIAMMAEYRAWFQKPSVVA